jgi:hypothetical protein
VEVVRTADWLLRLFAGAIGLVAMVLSRLPHIVPADLAGGTIPIGLFRLDYWMAMSPSCPFFSLPPLLS